MSALDVSIQSQILRLLLDLQQSFGLTYLFIAHDLAVVRHISDRIAVLYLGRIMELGSAETVFNGPHHPYTEALVSSVPAIDGSQRVRVRLGGEVPSPANPPSGCVLNPRCPRMAGSGVEHLCTSVEPDLVEAEPVQRLDRARGEGLDRRLRLARRRGIAIAERVGRPDAAGPREGRHLLRLARPLDRPDLVPDRRRPLELERLRGGGIGIRRRRALEEDQQAAVSTQGEPSVWRDQDERLRCDGIRP